MVGVPLARARPAALARAIRSWSVAGAGAPGPSRASTSATGRPSWRATSRTSVGRRGRRETPAAAGPPARARGRRRSAAPAWPGRGPTVEPAAAEGGLDGPDDHGQRLGDQRPEAAPPPQIMASEREAAEPQRRLEPAGQQGREARAVVGDAGRRRGTYQTSRALAEQPQRHGRVVGARIWSLPNTCSAPSSAGRARPASRHRASPSAKHPGPVVGDGRVDLEPQAGRTAGRRTRPRGPPRGVDVAGQRRGARGPHRPGPGRPRPGGRGRRALSSRSARAAPELRRRSSPARWSPASTWLASSASAERDDDDLDALVGQHPGQRLGAARRRGCRGSRRPAVARPAAEQRGDDHGDEQDHGRSAAGPRPDRREPAAVAGRPGRLTGRPGQVVVRARARSAACSRVGAAGRRRARGRRAAAPASTSPGRSGHASPRARGRPRGPWPRGRRRAAPLDLAQRQGAERLDQGLVDGAGGEGRLGPGRSSAALTVASSSTGRAAPARAGRAAGPARAAAPGRRRAGPTTISGAAPRAAGPRGRVEPPVERALDPAARRSSRSLRGTSGSSSSRRSQARASSGRRRRRPAGPVSRSDPGSREVTTR